MAALSFPANPTLNQTYTAVSKTWKWDGSAWVAVPYTITGAAGAAGSQGIPGEQAFNSFMTMGA